MVAAVGLFYELPAVGDGFIVFVEVRNEPIAIAVEVFSRAVLVCYNQNIIFENGYIHMVIIVKLFFEHYLSSFLKAAKPTPCCLKKVSIVK